ncbi:MAG: hypothetical protein CME61_02895 [Halobacteriovoraceae bacterium]|nr:hypothetical protein [Halobacteriovoraceae bacterium]
MGSFKSNRRNFLKASLASLGLSSLNFDYLLQIISKSVISDLMASEPNPNNQLNYVGINLHGGPNRWLWDLPLHVSSGQNNLTYNQCVITKFGNPGGPLGRYECVNKNGVLLPSIWDSNINIDGVIEPADGWVPMDSLSQNCLFIRGVVLPNGAHEGFWHNLITSVGSPGIHTFPQGQSGYNRPLDCVQMSTSVSGTYPYNPKGDGSSFNIVYNHDQNPVNKILTPFNFDRSTLHSPFGANQNNLPRGFESNNLEGENVEVKSKINLALESLEQAAREINKKSGKLFVDHRRAKEQFIRLTDSILDEYSERRSLYLNIISSNIRPPPDQYIPNVEGVHTSRGGDHAKLYQYQDKLCIAPGVNLDSIFASAHINSMAGSMAFIETLLKNDLTCSVVTGIGSMFDLSALNSAGHDVTFKLNNDSHFVGSALALIGFSKYYRCLSGCLHALRSSLASSGMWNKTIVHIHGDFNRAPRTDGYGTDHGPSGSNVLLMSGLIDQCRVIGSTYINCPERLRYDWGIAAEYPRFGYKPFTNEHIERSFAGIFGASSSAPNVEPIFEVLNGRLVPTQAVQNSAINVPYPGDED